MARMTKQEKEWQAEADARALAEAKVIGADAKRLHAAKLKAREEATEMEQRARSMRSAAAPKKAAKKAPARRKATKKR